MIKISNYPSKSSKKIVQIIVINIQKSSEILQIRSKSIQVD